MPSPYRILSLNVYKQVQSPWPDRSNNGHRLRPRESDLDNSPSIQRLYTFCRKDARDPRCRARLACCTKPFQRPHSSIYDLHLYIP